MPSDQQPNHLHRLCKGVIAKDSSIRFAGIANQMGNLIEAAYREGLQPLMDKKETEHYTIQTVLRASTREKQDFKYFYLLVSFDLGSDVISIVEDKILPLIKQFQKDSLVA